MTLFECLTALFFSLYQVQDGAFGVIETGIGGRLDVTNIVTPFVSVITPIELDHTDLLGDTISQIAAEKAGIIKPNVPVVVSAQSPEALAVISAAARERGAKLIHAQEYARITQIKQRPNFSGVSVKLRTECATYSLSLSAGGAHQAANAAVAVAAFETLRQQAGALRDLAFTDKTVQVRLNNSIALIQRAPYPIVADSCHTASSATALADTLLENFPQGQKFILLVGCVAGHPHAATLSELKRLSSQFFLTTPQHPKAIPAASLAATVSDQNVTLTDSAATALNQINQLPDIANSAVVVCGSNAIAAEVTQLLSGTASDFYTDAGSATNSASARGTI